jgi:hypothetical protein
VSQGNRASKGTRLPVANLPGPGISSGARRTPLQEHIDQIDLKTLQIPIEPFLGAHLQLARLVSFMAFNTTKKYAD